VGQLILKQKVTKPVLAGVCRPQMGRPPKRTSQMNERYVKLRKEMHELLQELRLLTQT